MRNAVLHLITNKSGNFGLDLLPATSSFVPYTPSPQETDIRNALFINSSPYYLVNSLIAAYSFEDILDEFNESSRTFELHNLPKSNLQITNATYANTPTTNFNVAYSPSIFPRPENMTWTITYNDGTNLDLLYAGQLASIPYTVLDGDVVTAEWPEDSGIRGGFKLNAGLSWCHGTVITLNVPPISFPYYNAVKYLQRYNSTSLYHVLNISGLSRNFVNAQSGIEQYALIMLGISNPGIRNPKIASC